MPRVKREARMALAHHMQKLIGEHTVVLAPKPDTPEEAARQKEAVHPEIPLKDEETIANLPVGLRRFEIPDEFNYLKLYQKVAASSADPVLKTYAQMALGRIFENRHQFTRALEYWKQLLVIGPAKGQELITKLARDHRDQILGEWVRFERRDARPFGEPQKAFT